MILDKSPNFITTVSSLVKKKEEEGEGKEEGEGEAGEGDYTP